MLTQVSVTNASWEHEEAMNEMKDTVHDIPRLFTISKNICNLGRNSWTSYKSKTVRNFSWILLDLVAFLYIWVLKSPHLNLTSDLNFQTLEGDGLRGC